MSANFGIYLKITEDASAILTNLSLSLIIQQGAAGSIKLTSRFAYLHCLYRLPAIFDASYFLVN